MPLCKVCKEEVDELTSLKKGKRTLRVCEDCAEQLQAADAILEESESVIQQMMEFKGRR